jgi:hypothetical protein
MFSQELGRGLHEHSADGLPQERAEVAHIARQQVGASRLDGR